MLHTIEIVTSLKVLNKF